MVVIIHEGKGRRTISRVDPVHDPAWAALVGMRRSTLFHSPSWMKVLCRTYGLPISAYVLEEDGRPSGGVAWCDLDDFLGRRRVTLAFSDLCDPLADSVDAMGMLVESVLADGLPWTVRALARNMPKVVAPVVHSTLFQWQAIHLMEDSQALWNGLSSMAQRGVQKAERSGLKAREATEKGELRDWYLQHLRLRKTKHGLLAQPYAFFENIWEAFIEKGQGFLLLADYEGRIVGGTLYLLWQDTCFYKFNASDPTYLPVRPNNLLMWEGALRAKERGCRLLDLGRSNANQEGLVRFKQGFGAVAEELYSVTYQPGADDPAGSREVRHLLEELTGLFVQESVPDDVTEGAGALLYRYFA